MDKKDRKEYLLRDKKEFLTEKQKQLRREILFE